MPGDFTLVTGTSSLVSHTPASGSNPEFYTFLSDTNTADTTFVISTTLSSINLNYIIIGGGGAGGTGDTMAGYAGSGGNSSTIVTGTITFYAATNYTIIIGKGGQPNVTLTGDDGNVTSINTGTSGSYTVLFESPGGTGGAGGTSIISNGTGATGSGGSGGQQITFYIPSIATKFCGGGGRGADSFVDGNQGGDSGTSGGNGSMLSGTSYALAEPGQTPGSGGGGGGSQQVAGAAGAAGRVYLYAALPINPPPGSVCFLAGTPVETDQGEVAIDKLDTQVNTINGKRIVAVTQTPGQKDCLVLIKKNLLGENMPNKDTVISIWHRVLYQEEMEEACRIPDTELVPYNGEILYNVLLDEHDTMKVNGLTVETLDPDHKVAKYYRNAELAKAST